MNMCLKIMITIELHDNNATLPTISLSLDIFDFIKFYLQNQLTRM